MLACMHRFGTGTDFCTFGPKGSAVEGVARQPGGFTRNQVLAYAVDPRTFYLSEIPQDQHAGVWELVKSDVVKLQEEAALKAAAAIAAHAGTNIA